MPLSARPPEDTKPRLKLMLSGDGGCGKTRASIQVPRPYIIDTEGGTTQYAEIIKASGGVRTVWTSI